MKREIEKLYIHCSVSHWGTAYDINIWHLARGWRRGGYHLVIGNGCPNNDKIYYDYLDGQIENGRPPDMQGAGVKYDNKHSFHICLIGMPGDFTDAQLDTLFDVLFYFTQEGIVAIDDIWGHYEYWTKKGEPAKKSCPGLDMEKLRKNFAQFVKGKKRKYIPLPNIEIIDPIIYQIIRRFEHFLGKTP